MHNMVVAASPQRDRSAVAAWIADAARRGERGLYKHAPTEGADVVLPQTRRAAGLDAAVRAAGAVLPVDTAVLRDETGGRSEALYALHREQAERAAREGYAGLAMTGDAAAMRTITSGLAELVGYERALEHLAAEAGVRSLCRYATGESPDLLERMLTTHYREVDDDGWAARVADDRLHVRGELDFSNAGLFSPVLRAALRAGVRTIDASRLEFCDVAGVRTMVTATDLLPSRELPVRVVGVDRVLARLLEVTGVVYHPGLRLVPREADA